MTGIKILRIRIVISTVAFLALCGTLIPILKNWSPNLNFLFLFLLLLLSLAMLANGVSYLSEILKKNRSCLRLTAGILSLFVFTIVLFPALNNKPENYIYWIWIITFYLDAILISLSSLLELFNDWTTIKVYSFIFALYNAIFFISISSMIFRDESIGQGGIGIIFCGAILFVFSIMVNMLVAANLKTKNKEDHGVI